METKEQVLNAFRLELNKWLNHSIRGMKSGNPAYFQGKITLIHDLLGFIHDIDNQEEPDKSLEEEINKWLDGPTTDLRTTARHFAEWQKQQFEKNYKEIFNDYWTRGFEEGRADMKEELLKDAVEGEVYKFAHYSYVKERNRDDLTKYLSKFNDGDKVRIVVLKEEE